jgi:hypothetical protein
MYCGVWKFELPINTKNEKLVRDYPLAIHVQFEFNQVSSFWKEKKSSFAHKFYMKTFSSDGSHLEFLIDTTILVKYNKMYILAKFAVKWLTGFWYKNMYF